MSSATQCSTNCNPIQGIHEEQGVSDSVEVRVLVSTPVCSHTPQEAHAAAGSASTTGLTRIASKKAAKSKTQLREEESQRRIEEDALINAEIQFPSKTTPSDLPAADKEILDQPNSSIEVQSDHSESDDDNYYTLSGYPKLSPAERLEMLKEKVSEKMSEVQAKSRIKHSVARRPAVLCRTRYGQLKAIPPNFNSSQGKKLLEGSPSSITPSRNETRFVQETHTPLDRNAEACEITDKEQSIESESA